MAKKQWTDEERKAFGEKMKAARQNKNPQTESENLPEQTAEGEFEQPTLENTPAASTETIETIVGEPTMLQLQAQMLEVMKMLAGQNTPTPTGASVNNGQLTGVTERYRTDASLYPDPTARLAAEPRLAIFAFDLNFELIFEVSRIEYENINKVRMAEPRFTLKLVRIMLDPETGEDTGNRYVTCQMVLHEDPETALVIARQIGYDVAEQDETTFLNEMRYIRMRDWLLECFFPSRPSKLSESREMVVNNRLVQVYSKFGEDGNTTVGKTDWDSISKNKFRV